MPDHDSTMPFYCTIPSVPFRGVPCSDAAGQEIAYNEIVSNVLLPSLTSSNTVVRWDDIQKASSVTRLEYAHENHTKHIRQYWFDTSRSLRMKYQYARSMNLRGVGPFAFQYANYHQPHPKDDEDEAKLKRYLAFLWTSFDSFFVV